MTIKKLMEGLQVMIDAGVDPDDILISAAHDTIWAGPDRFSPETEAKLKQLGWHWFQDTGSWGAYV